ncbi:leucyl aminopeptidase [Croceibacterium sp. TMG7-5b_MA50]|uniref:leucyl aminopeptidase n=1 Tax=Croceibacterium sp. TMG7-5b_MA50 TaxID=3121290 RepID=UPI0032220201
MQIEFTPVAPAATSPLIAGVFAEGQLPQGLEPTLAQGAAAMRFTGKPGQLFDGFVERDGSVVRVVLAGMGADDADRPHALEKAGGALAARFLTSGNQELVIEASNLSAEAVAHLLTGLTLRSWRYDNYRTRLKDDQKVSLQKVIVASVPEGAEAAWADASALVEGVGFTRELVTEPANIIYPETFVERCRARFEGTGAELTVLDEAEMAELGMGALLGVSQGSVREARVLAIRWNGGVDGAAPMAFVGKGVTFDTGGISIKPAGGMEDMKWDMGGAGAVAGAMLALVKRRAKANIIGVVGLVENMPDGNAQRPGDVVTTMSGQTVEVINTDAEGRLVLCDVLTWLQRTHKPTAIVDFATLTGAMIIALGSEHGGLFSNNDQLAGDLLQAGLDTGDKLWRFPLSPAYDKLIDSPIADIRNVGPRGAGSITAAQFIARFVENDTPWAHCDIAGMVWADKPGDTWGKGATGFGVRLIDRYVRAHLEG